MVTSNQYKTLAATSGIFVIILMYVTSNLNGAKQTIVLTPVNSDQRPSTYTKDSCENILGSRSILVNQSDFRIQLLAAVPGSGSKWCKTSISLLTGYMTSAVPSFQQRSKFKVLDKALENLPLPIYLKTHFPFQRPRGEISESLNNNPDRVVVLIRHPFDAGFSEYVRSTTKHLVHGRDDKYHGIESAFNTSHFLSVSSGHLKPSEGFRHYYVYFLKKWVSFHRYWLETYQGNLKVMFYSDMVKNERLFSDIAGFFGYITDANPHSRRRTECFYENYAITKSAKRPRVPLIEESKEKLRTMFADDTRKQIAIVENIYFNKYRQRRKIS